MKKLITLMALLGLITAGAQTFAMIDANRLMEEDYLRNNGYSPETIRMMNLKRVDPYAPYIEEEVKHTPVNWVKRFHKYIDPTVDNGRFGKGVINPSINIPSGL